MVPKTYYERITQEPNDGNKPVDQQQQNILLVRYYQRGKYDSYGQLLWFCT